MASELVPVFDTKEEFYNEFQEISLKKVKIFLARLEKQFPGMLSAPAVARLKYLMQKQLAPELEKLTELKIATDKKIEAVIKKLAEKQPGLLKDIGATLSGSSGALGGIAVSHWLIGALGVHGLSAAGITSGLAVLGAGSMMIDVAVAALPVVALAGTGWWLWSSFQGEKIKGEQRTFLKEAIRELEPLLFPLLRYPDFLHKEAEGLNTLIKEMKKKLSKVSA